jgi:hypothetical protein
MTEHYVGVDVHKTKSQVAVIDDNGEIEEEVRVNNTNLDEIAQKYAGSEAAIEATSNYFTIYDTLDEHLDITLANPLKANWLANQKQKPTAWTQNSSRGFCGWAKYRKHLRAKTEVDDTEPTEHSSVLGVASAHAPAVR